MQLNLFIFPYVYITLLLVRIELIYTFLILCSNIGTGLNEEVHTGGSRTLNGPHEGCASTQGLGIYVGPSLHQKFNKFHLTRMSRVV